MKFYLMFVAAMLIFGSNGVFASMLEMSGAQLVLLRTLIGGAVLLIIILISRSRTPKEVLLRENGACSSPGSASGPTGRCFLRPTTS